MEDFVKMTIIKAVIGGEMDRRYEAAKGEAFRALQIRLGYAKTAPPTTRRARRGSRSHHTECGTATAPRGTGAQLRLAVGGLHCCHGAEMIECTGCHHRYDEHVNGGACQVEGCGCEFFDTRYPETELDREPISDSLTDDQVDTIIALTEEAVGMGRSGWDTINARLLVRCILSAADTYIVPLAECAEPTGQSPDFVTLMRETAPKAIGILQTTRLPSITPEYAIAIFIEEVTKELQKGTESQNAEVIREFRNHASDISALATEMELYARQKDVNDPAKGQLERLAATARRYSEHYAKVAESHEQDVEDGR